MTTTTRTTGKTDEQNDFVYCDNRADRDDCDEKEK